MSNEKRQKELQEKIDLIINQMNRLEEEKIELEKELAKLNGEEIDDEYVMWIQSK